MSSEFAVRRNQNEQGENELKKREVRLTRISISIVLIFIICHVPRCIINILELSLGGLHDKVRIVETDPKKPGQDQKLATDKKSTIFELSS